jgi:DNA-binding beta-propeller fold protein YncE
VGGAARVAAGPLLGQVALATAPKPCAPSPPGARTSALAIDPDTGLLWTGDAAATTITSHRLRGLARERSLEIGGAPRAIALSPGGRHALVTTAFYDRPGVSIVDLASGQLDHLDVGPDPGAVAFTATGRSAYVVGGGRRGTLTRIDPASGRVHDPIELGAHPRGLALYADDEHALVALNGEACVAVVSLARRRVTHRIATRAYPLGVAVSPDGSRGFVTHAGFREERVTPLDLVRRRARPAVVSGLDPAGVAFDASGTLAVVANAGAGTVSLFDARSGRRRRRVRTGGEPRFVACAGRRAVIADGRTGQLRAVRLGVIA